MSPKKRQVLSTRSAMLTMATGLLLGVGTFAYGMHANALRDIRGNTVFSKESPKVELSVSKGFRFVGTRKINLYGNAEAEQYVFARPGRNHIAQSFYLVQFEHFLPSNDRTYHYDSMRQTQIGDLNINYDVKSWPDLANVITKYPGSDLESLRQLLAKQNLSFPNKTVLVRMVYLPTADHRTELMIIYGEALPEDSAIPVRNEGVSLDTESPGSAQMFLEHARRGLAVQAH